MVTVLDRRVAPTAQPSRNSKPIPRPNPIYVDGIEIPRDEIARETQYHPAARPVDAWRLAAQALVIRQLLLQEARRLAIVPEPVVDAAGRHETEEEALIRQLMEEEVKIPEADETACRRVYEAQRAKFRTSELYAVRHILFAATPDDGEVRRAARVAAEAAIATLSAAPELFAELAASLSACPSRAQGGDLGQISRGQTVPEFEAALAEASIGVIAPMPVETRFGFHVIRLEQRIEGRALPFETVRDRIAAWLTECARQTAIRQYIELLAGRAVIIGIELDQQQPQPA